MTKKGSFIGGWVGVGQLLVAVRQTVQCIKRIFVIKSFKMDILQTCMVFAYGAASGNAVKCKYCTGKSFQTGLYLIQKRLLPRCND
jgi:hypothetical protein